MALSPGKAVEAARSILNGPRVQESTRLERIARALRPAQASVSMPEASPRTMRDLARKSATNYLPLILENFTQTMFVDGYRPSGSTDNAGPWDAWQANQLDARQTGLYWSTLKYGAAYTTVLPGAEHPMIRGVSPRKMTALYADPDEDEWPILALRVDGPMIRLFDEEQVYFIGDEQPPRAPSTPPLMRGPSPSSLTFIEGRAHGLGVCPVVRFRDRMFLEGEEQLGLVEPILSIQERVDETVFGLMVAQYFQAFKQRYIVGWLPPDEDVALKTKASELWTFKDPDVKVGQLDQADLAQIIGSKDSAVHDMAVISQVPPQNIASGKIANLAADALAAMQDGKERKSDGIRTSLGESWEQTLRLSAVADGDEMGANDLSAQVRWRDTSARSLAQTVDALGKAAQMLGIPSEALWERIPGVSEQDIEAWKQIIASRPPPPPPPPASPAAPYDGNGGMSMTGDN